jgi:hypothetical protein
VDNGKRKMSVFQIKSKSIVEVNYHGSYISKSKDVVPAISKRNKSRDKITNTGSKLRGSFVNKTVEINSKKK